VPESLLIAFRLRPLPPTTRHRGPGVAGGRMVRISVNLTPEQVDALKARAIETGVPQSEQIRRAVNLAVFADAQGARMSSQQPVLFTPQKETR
jgi:hypothetical protein